MTHEEANPPVCWPDGEKVRECDSLFPGDKVLVPTFSGPGHYSMHIAVTNDGIVAQGTTKLIAILAYENGVLVRKELAQKEVENR